MKIWIDADACPVTRIVEEVGREYGLEVIALCDTSHMIRLDYGKVITVDKGADSADFALISRTVRGDLVVTQDYGVAAMALGRGVYAIHQSGRLYTEANIDQLLMERHLAKKARRASSKHHGKGQKKRTQEDDLMFEQALRGLLEEQKRAEATSTSMALSLEELKLRGALYISNVQEGMEVYPYQILEGEDETLRDFLKEQIEKNGWENAYVDCYFGRLTEQEKKRVGEWLSKEQQDYLETLCQKENPIYFSLTEELFQITFALSVKEALFSTFYFTKEPVTVWSNYENKFVVFYKKKE